MLGGDGQSEDQLTLELYASEEDGGMGSNVVCHLRGEVEVDLLLSLERRGQDSMLACWRPSSIPQLIDPLLSIVGANVDMFGERALERFFADGRREPSARWRHCGPVDSALRFSGDECI